MLDGILSINDMEYVSGKKMKRMECMLLGLFIISAINMILLFCVCGTIAFYAPELTSVISLVNKHKDKISASITTITEVAKKVDTISDTVLNFKSIAKDKLLVTLCNNRIIQATLGSYFCPDPNNSDHVPELYIEF